MSKVAQIEVRHPYVGEVPTELMQGFEVFRIDPEWQWVMLADGKVVAQMLCVNMHGMLGIMRLTSLSDMPPGALLTFLRGVLRMAREQGCFAYMTYLTDQKPLERKLMRITQRSGAGQIPSSGVWAFGSTEARY